MGNNASCNAYVAVYAYDPVAYSLPGHISQAIAVHASSSLVVQVRRGKFGRPLLEAICADTVKHDPACSGQVEQLLATVTPADVDRIEQMIGGKDMLRCTVSIAARAD